MREQRPELITTQKGRKKKIRKEQRRESAKIFQINDTKLKKSLQDSSHHQAGEDLFCISHTGSSIH